MKREKKGSEGSHMMLRLAVLFTLLAVSASGAGTEFEADSFYRTATDYLDDGDHKNAVKYAHRSLEIYEDLENQRGANKARQVIADIESVLSPLQVADTYYSIAGSYYIQDNPTGEDLDWAIEMANIAKAKYTAIGGAAGATGAIKSEDLIKGAENLLNQMAVDCIREGDELYRKAQDAWFAQDYINSKSYAVSASQTYGNCPYQPGIDKSAVLLTSLNAKISELTMQAKAAYDTAILYHSEDTEEGNALCKSYAQEAQNLYKKVGDDEGYFAATSVYSKCSEDWDEIRQLRLREAQRLFDEAQALSIIPDCVNATDKADEAQDIYNYFLAEAIEKEKKLNPDQRVDTLKFQSYINQVKALKATIREACGEIKLKQIAENYYGTCQGLYLKNELDEAMTYCRRSLDICDQLKDYVCSSKTNSFISLIKFRIDQGREASLIVEEAYGYMGVADFQKALTQATRAKTIYLSIDDQEKADTVDKIIENITDGMKRMEDAGELFGRAQEALETEDYSNAIKHGEAAQNLYLSVNYTLGASKAKDIVSEAKQKKGEFDTKKMTNILITAVVVFFVGTVLYVLMRRKRMIETEYVKRQEEEDKRVKRRDEEWELRKEEETKAHVEDELRKLIDDERVKSDE